MRQLFKPMLLTFMILMFTGCASNYYNVPRDVYEKKVRVLGVAPMLLDAESDISHPEKADVLKLIREANRRNEKELVEILKGNGEYFSVRLLEEDAGQLFSSIISRRERRDDAGIVYNKYFFKPEELRKLVTRHNVDAVMVVVVSGINLTEKVYSNSFMAYLEDSYNNLTMTGQIYDSDASLLWEYPNFRQRFLTYSPFLALQYPDFEESRANLSDQVKVRYKSVDGIARALAKSESSSVNSSRLVASLYNRQFTEMNSLLKYFRNPFSDSRTEKSTANPLNTAPGEGSISRRQEPFQPSVSPARTVLPQQMPSRPEPRQLQPVAPLEPGTQMIREPEIK